MKQDFSELLSNDFFIRSILHSFHLFFQFVYFFKPWFIFPLSLLMITSNKVQFPTVFVGRRLFDNFICCPFILLFIFGRSLRLAPSHAHNDKNKTTNKWLQLICDHYRIDSGESISTNFQGGQICNILNRGFSISIWETIACDNLWLCLIFAYLQFAISVVFVRVVLIFFFLRKDWAQFDRKKNHRTHTC